MKVISLREALSNPESEFRRAMNEHWMDYVCSQMDTDGEKRDVEECVHADNNA